jgi:hypothetical protein
MELQTNRLLDCDIIQDMLLHQDPIPANEMVATPLRLHLQACAACRQFSYLLHQTRDALAVPQTAPDPHMQHRLRNAVGQTHGRHPIGIFLRQRMPVYQAVLGVLAVTLVFLGADQISLNLHSVVPALAQNSSLEYTRIDSYEVLEKLKLIEKKGIGHTEDSLLIRYLIAQENNPDAI